jgi:hypothetical protein
VPAEVSHRRSGRHDVTRQQRRHLRCRRALIDVAVHLDPVEFKIVDDADRIPVVIGQLAIQQV